MGGEGAINAIVENRGYGDATLGALGWEVGVSMEDLGLADVVRRLFWQYLVYLLRSIRAAGCKEMKNPLAFTWLQMEQKRAQGACWTHAQESVSNFRTAKCNTTA